jgi:hypothetical protein
VDAAIQQAVGGSGARRWVTPVPEDVVVRLYENYDNCVSKAITTTETDATMRLPLPRAFAETSPASSYACP